MPELATISQGPTATATPYATNWAHLADELKRLDLRLRLLLRRGRDRKQASQPNLLDEFRGLVLTEEEVSRLLADSDIGGAGTFSPNDSEDQRLLQACDELDQRLHEGRDASRAQSVFLALPYLAQLFNLTSFEEQCLLICLAPELDRKYEKLYAYVQDDVTRRKPSVALVLDVLCRSMQEKLAARAVFDPQAPLLKFRLVQMSDGATDASEPLLSRALKLDDRIAGLLLDHREPDARLEPFSRLLSPQPPVNSGAIRTELQEHMSAFLRAHFNERKANRRSVIFHLYGPYGSGKRALVESATRELGLNLLTGDIELMKNGTSSFEEMAWLLAREASLQPAVLYLENLDCLLSDPDKHRAQLKTLLDAARTFSPLTFLGGAQTWQASAFLRDEVFIALELARADASVEKQIWESQASGHSFAAGVDWDTVYSKFRFTPGQIRDALAAAANLAAWRSPAAPQITMEDLHAACRAQATPKLDLLARRLTPNYTWADIILPDDQIAQLREMCEHALHRHIVYGEWGFARKLSRGKGLNALFSGPPGTGKTMAAEVIANQLQLDLFQIDLSQVVSKYIGETEKNLYRIFDEAQSSNAILFFDEADALFGKRSEVKDAHDRYANIEIGYLLQKMEEYEGIAILATNLRQNLDEAFVRRMQFIVEFPFPDEEYRRRIWEVMFPPEAPIGEDVDLAALARDVRLAGGNIKNIALAAAFFAASDGKVIQMPHLTRAARREFQKLGRTWHVVELNPSATVVS